MVANLFHREPTALIPEGQETEDFWDTIGGKGPHPYMDPSKVSIGDCVL